MRWIALAMALLLAGCGAAAPAPSASQPAGPSASAAAPASKAAAAQASLPPAKPGQIVVAYSETLAGHAPLWAAKDGGIFEKNGLDVEPRLIESSLSIGALLSGQAQLGQVGGSESLAAAVEGGDLKVLGILGAVYSFKLEVAADIKKPEDLKGKKVGISRIGSSSDTITRLGLKKLGLEPDKDVNIVQIGSNPARTAAMISGAIQGSMTLPPDNLSLEDKGFHSLIDMADLGLPANDNGITVQGAWLAAHRPEVQKYIDSMVQSIARLKRDKPFAIDVLRKYLKTDDARLLDTGYEAFVVKVTPALPYPKPEQFNDSVQRLAEQNPKAKTFDLNGFLDPSFVKSAADRGLDKG